MNNLILLLLLLSLFSHVQLCATPQAAGHQAPQSLGSPGKNTEVGCHFLLQCMKVKTESEVAQSCRTPRDPMDCSPPGSSIHGIFQARVLKWVAIAFSRLLSSMWNLPRPRISYVSPTLASGFLTTEPPGMSHSPPLLKKNAIDLITKPGQLLCITS